MKIILAWPSSRTFKSPSKKKPCNDLLNIKFSFIENGCLPEESVDTAELIMLFDDLFDSVNANFHKEEGKIYRSAVTPNSPHLEFWNKTLPILKSMKYVNNKGKEATVPSLTSWVKSIEGFKYITNRLRSEGINSLLLRNINQDPLENFFGAIRAHGYNNVMPNSAAFETAFKTLLINNITSPHSLQANCEKDDSFCLNSLKSLINQNCNVEDDKEITEIIYEHLNMNVINTQIILESCSRVHVEKCAAIAYCSGWIATKAKKYVFKKCKTCRNNLITSNNEDFHKFIIKKEYCGKRWLCYPTRALFDFFAQVEHITSDILNQYGHIEKIAKYIELIVTVNLDLNFIKCKKHNKQLNNYLLHKSVVFFIMNWCKEVSNVLTGKSHHNFCNESDEIDPIFQQAREHYNKTKGAKRERQTGVEINL